MSSTNNRRESKAARPSERALSALKRTGRRSVKKPDIEKLNKKRAEAEQKNIVFITAGIVILLVRRFFKKLTKRAHKYFARDKNRLSYFGDYELGIVFAGAFALVLVILFVFWSLTNRNAYEVYLDDAAVGIVKSNKNITSDTLFSTVTGKISNDLGLKIKSDQKITFKNIHAPSKKMEPEDALITKLTDALAFTVEATVVTLNGEPVAYLKSDSEYALVCEKLIAPYRKGGVIVEEGFVENIETLKQYVEKTKIMTEETAYNVLNSKRESEITYIIQSGDTLGAVAANFGTTVEEVCRTSNIPLEEAAKLKIGAELKIASKKPLVSVYVIESSTYTREKPYETITRTDPTKSAGYTAVLRPGKNGEAEVTEHAKYINGVLNSRQDISENIIISPTDEIVEVGTG